MKKSRVTVGAVVAAPLRKVWNCWTEPEHIIHWNFASDEWHCPSAKNDLRVGGSFNCRMASRDGKIGFDFEGMYDEVVDQSKIGYSMADGRQVSVSFESFEGGTKVTESFDPESENSEELQRSGWQAILNNFKKYVEAN